jgi:hypothetical protein
MTGQEQGDLLIQVTALAGLTILFFLSMNNPTSCNSYLLSTDSDNISKESLQ